MIFVVIMRKPMNITIKTDKSLCNILDEVFIKMHDDFLRENNNAVFDWICESEGSEKIRYTLSFENLPKDDVQYVLETLEIMERNFNG